VGSSVTISGADFTGATGVSFNGVAAAFTVDSDSQITATVPAGATTGPIAVTTPGGTAVGTGDFTVVAGPPSYQSTVLTDGPAGYWRLGETSGSAIDTTGRAAGGTYNGGGARGVPGAIAGDPDGAAGFDGVNDYVSVPDNSFIDVGDVFTYELWVRRGTTRSVTQRLIHKGAGPAALGFGTNNKLLLLPGGTGAATTATSTVTVNDDLWHHVVVTKNGADIHIYLDGVDVTVLGTNTTMTNNATALNIGRASTSSAYFNGQIDELAIYPTALTAQQVAAHHQAGR
jgi:hypothetical protein